MVGWSVFFLTVNIKEYIDKRYILWYNYIVDEEEIMASKKENFRDILNNRAKSEIVKDVYADATDEEKYDNVVTKFEVAIGEINNILNIIPHIEHSAVEDLVSEMFVQINSVMGTSATNSLLTSISSLKMEGFVAEYQTQILGMLRQLCENRLSNRVSEQERSSKVVASSFEAEITEKSEKTTRRVAEPEQGDKSIDSDYTISDVNSAEPVHVETRITGEVQEKQRVNSEEARLRAVIAATRELQEMRAGQVDVDRVASLRVRALVVALDRARRVRIPEVGNKKEPIKTRSMPKQDGRKTRKPSIKQTISLTYEQYPNVQEFLDAFDDNFIIGNEEELFNFASKIKKENRREYRVLLTNRIEELSTAKTIR